MKILLLATLFCLASPIELVSPGNLRGMVDSADSYDASEDIDSSDSADWYDSSEDVPAAVTVRIAKKP